MLLDEESVSFIQSHKLETTDLTHKRLAEMIFKQEHFESHFDESRLMETPNVLQMPLNSNASCFMPEDQSHIMQRPTPDISFVREVQNLDLSSAP